jgi:hypothetical protein
MFHSGGINSPDPSEGTWDARWDFSEPEEASTGAADMSASRVEVGNGGPCGSEHDQCLVEIRRLEAEIERRDAEIERLLARDAPMVAEIRRLTAENEVPLRERERRREAESVRGGSAPGGLTNDTVDIPAVSAGFNDGGPETQHARIANDAMDDEDAGGKERSHVYLLAEIRRLTAEIERLQEARLQAGPGTNSSVGDGVLESRHAKLPAHIRWLTAELERVHAQLEAELRVNDTVEGISPTLSPAPSTAAMLGEEAPSVAGYTSTPVLPFVDERAVRAPLQDPPTSAEGHDGSTQPEIRAADIAANTSGVDDGISRSGIHDAKIQRLVTIVEHLEARLDTELRGGDSRLDESCVAMPGAAAALVSSLDFLITRLGLADFEHDGAWRDEMVDELRKGGQVYSEEEAQHFAEATDMLNNVAKSTGKVVPMKRAKTVQMACTKYDKRTDRLVGEVELLVPASPEQVVAFLMHSHSKFNLSHLDPDIDVRWELLEAKNLHHIVCLSEMKTAPFQNRTFLSAILWRKLSDTPPAYVVVTVPIERHAKLHPQDEAHAVRAEMKRVFEITCTGDGSAQVKYACSLDVKGHFPQAFTNAVAIPRLMATPYTVQTYFLHVKPTADFTADDGKLLGHLLADAAQGAPPHERASAITKFVLRTTVLRECELVFFDAMLAAFFAAHFGLAKFKTVFAQPVSTTDLAKLTAAELTTIGSGLDMILRTSTDHIEAINEFLATYPAMDEMAKRHAWARPMLETVAQRRMVAAPFGLKLRLVIGALLSMADMASDINNLVRMLGAGQSVGAYALLAMILTTLALQIAIVVVQNAHRGPVAVFKEVLMVLSLCKAGVDALRVARGEGHVAGAPIDPFTEMIMCKGFEMVFESIPGGLVQAIFILYNGVTTAALLSILLSCLSTAFTVTMVAYDLDTNAARRKNNPEFFGYARMAIA